MDNYDHYRVAEEIADDLVSEGFDDWAHRIRDAIRGGSTGTEILMAIRWTFGELKTQRIRVSKPVQRRIADLVARLDEALR